MKLSADQIEVGKQYIMVESPLYESVVTVLEDRSQPGWVSWKVRVDRVDGILTPKLGDYLDIGWNPARSQYALNAFYALNGRVI